MKLKPWNKTHKSDQDLPITKHAKTNVKRVTETQIPSVMLRTQKIGVN